MISGEAFSPFLYFVFVAIIYNMTIQLRINNIYNSAIRHNILRLANGRSIIIWIFFSRSNAIPNY